MNKPEREIDDRLADWVDGRLTDRERERFVAEMRVNPQLRADLAAYERTVAAVREALRAPTRPADLADRVMGAIAVQTATVAAGRATWRRHPLYWSLAAAAALLVLAIGLNSWPSARTPERTPDTVASLDSLRRVDDAQVRDGKQIEAEKGNDAPGAALPREIGAAAAADDARTGQRELAKGDVLRTAGAPEPSADPGLLGRENLVTGVVPAPEGNAANVAGVTPGAKPAEWAGAVDPLITNKQQVTPVPPTENPSTVIGAAVVVAGGGTQQEAGNEPSARAPQSQSDVERSKQEASRALRNDGEDRAAKAGADERSAGELARGRAGSRRGYAGEQLPMVSLSRYRTAEQPATGGPAGPTAVQAPLGTFATGAIQPQNELDAFLASQVAQPSTFEKKLAADTYKDRSAADGVRHGSLSLVPLVAPEADAGRDTDASALAGRKRAEGAVPAPTGGAAPAESHWLVEGSRKEVADLLRKVAEYAKRSGLELTNGEIAGYAPALQGATVPGASKPQTPPAPTALPAPSGRVAPPAADVPPTNAPADVADHVQVVLRFRVLPPK